MQVLLLSACYNKWNSNCLCKCYCGTNKSSTYMSIMVCQMICDTYVDWKCLHAICLVSADPLTSSSVSSPGQSGAWCTHALYRYNWLNWKWWPLFYEAGWKWWWEWERERKRVVAREMRFRHFRQVKRSNIHRPPMCSISYNKRTITGLIKTCPL